MIKILIILLISGHILFLILAHEKGPAFFDDLQRVAPTIYILICVGCCIAIPFITGWWYILFMPIFGFLAYLIGGLLAWIDFYPWVKLFEKRRK